jgi:Ni/Co efflux regulator RcnB
MAGRSSAVTIVTTIDRYDSNRNGRYDRNDRNDRDGRFDRNDRGDGYYNAQHYRRGERLHQEYRSDRYVVSDWRERRLSAPPRGHHWVRAGNDYVLAAIATGIIAQVLLNN